MEWCFACPDWEARLREGRSLIPELPLDRAKADRAVAVYNKLRLPDVPGQPSLGEAGAQWFRDIVGALFGSVDPVTGERHVREILDLVPKKNSKALALDTLIATPSGFTTMGAVQIGDTIIASDGKPTRVLDKSIVFLGRPCFEVEFSTGEKVICDAEHLWVTDAHKDREKQKTRKINNRSNPVPTVKTTAEIAATLKVKSGKYEINNHRTALCGVLDLPEVSLPIPPYALGAWLGDGETAGSRVTAACSEVDAMVERLVACGQPAYVSARRLDKGASTISLVVEGVPPGAKLPYRFRTEAIKLGVLGNKHIPQIYLRASKGQRLELLRGLMDTDGNISIRGQASFTTTSPQLRDGVVELVASLGMKPCINSWDPVLNGVPCARAWRVSFFPYAGEPVFKMERKFSRQKQHPDRAARSESRQIVAVRPVPSVPTQCIMVESETKQFLVTKSLIPTHNSTNGAALMVTALLLNERPRAEFLLIGPTQAIADIAFSQAAGIISADPQLLKIFQIREHIKEIKDRRNGARLKIKTFDSKVLTGVKPVGVLVDELHELGKMANASKVIGQIRGGLLPNPEGFLVYITTQSDDPPRGVFRAELMKARAIRDGKAKGSMLPVLYEFPERMVKNGEWKDPANWYMVTPNNGKSITVERLQEDWNDAQLAGEEEIRRWASQHLNIEIGLALHSDRWAGADYWEQQADETLTLAEIIRRSEVITIGIDGGGLDDLLGLTVLGRDEATREWLSWSKAWAHTSVLERRKDIVSKLYDLDRAGDLAIVETLGDDIADIVDIVAEVEASGKLAQIGLDPVGIGAIVDALAERGFDTDGEGKDRIVGIPQGWKLSGAIKSAERKLADGTLSHADQPLMDWCVGNAKIEPKGNAVTITKQASGSAKIDPLMAFFNAVALMSANPPARGRSFWDSDDAIKRLLAA